MGFKIEGAATIIDALSVGASATSALSSCTNVDGKGAAAVMIEAAVTFHASATGDVYIYAVPSIDAGSNYAGVDEHWAFANVPVSAGNTVRVVIPVRGGVDMKVRAANQDGSYAAIVTVKAMRQRA